jgi:hypothetical protein
MAFAVMEPFPRIETALSGYCAALDALAARAHLLIPNNDLKSSDAEN